MLRRLPISPTATSPGTLRPVHIRHDLSPMADLIELCFRDTMDRKGEAMLRDMRATASLGPFLWLFHGLDRALRGLMQGFVWEAEGQIVGNISLYPAGHDQHWVIANVAVHPDYRRRGIAADLCRAGLARIRERGGAGALLQVEASNHGAIALYASLGFRQQRTFTHWHWSGGRKPPTRDDNAPAMTYLAYHERHAAYDFLQRLRPDSQGGIGWLYPTQRLRQRFSFGGLVAGLLSFDTRENFIVRAADKQPRALLLTKARFGTSTLHFHLIAPQEADDSLKSALLDAVLRRAYHGLRGAYTEHPADDPAMPNLLRARGFQAERTLIHMHHPLP